MKPATDAGSTEAAMAEMEAADDPGPPAPDMDGGAVEDI